MKIYSRAGGSARRGGKPRPDGDSPGRGSVGARRSKLRRARRLWLGVDILLALVLLAIVVAGGYFGYSAYRGHEMREGHREAEAAARQLVVDFLTVSASSVTQDTERVLDGSTGEFRDVYRSGLAEVRTAVVENKVSSTGKVLRSAVSGGDSDSVVVLVAADVRIRNVGSPKGRKAHYRVEVDMVYDGNRDRWLASDLEFVG